MIANPTLIEHIDVLYRKGFNIIPVNAFKKALVKWKEWQNKAIPQEVYEKWKRDGLFQNRICNNYWKDLERSL